MDQLSDLKLPVDFKEGLSSDEEPDFNPFQFSKSSDTFHSFERVFENHFEIKDKKWIVVPRDKIYLIKKTWNQLQNWIGIIKKEHRIITNAQVEYNQIKKLNQELYDRLLKIDHESQLKYDDLHNQYQKLIIDSEQKIEILQTTIYNLKMDILDKDKKIAKQERSISVFIEEESINFQIKQQQHDEVTRLRKELNQIKTIRKMGFINFENEEFDQKSIKKPNFSTFELLVNSKMKDKFIKFLNMTDILKLSISSKKLYLAFGLPKIIVPLGIKALLKTMEQNLSKMEIKDNQFNNLIQKCPLDQIKTTMIKTYEMKINFTDLINPILKESSLFIDGQQFLGVTQIRTDVHKLQDNIQVFLDQQSALYQYSLDALKNQQFPWKEIFGELVDISTTIQKQQQLPKDLHKKAEKIFERLFQLSGLCSSDSGLFSMYLSSMQRNLAQLFVFAQNLTYDAQQLQSMCYYLIRLYLENFKKMKQYEGEIDDAKEKFLVYSSTREYLNQRVRELEQSTLNFQIQLQNQSVSIFQKDQEIQKLNEYKFELDKQAQKSNDTLKQLASKTIMYKSKYNEIANQYNQLLEQFKQLASNVGEITYKY